MPGNEVGDRVHNFFAQETLSQGQHSHAVGGNWPSDDNLWVSSQKQLGPLSSDTRTYDPQQSENELRYNSQRVPVPDGFNFMQTTASPQSQHQNLNGYVSGRHVLPTRPDEASFLGLDTNSGQDNVNQRGFLVHESQQGGVSEQISNSHRSNEFDAHGSLNLFGGQHQMNSQHPGSLQPLQQHQSGFSLQQQLMLRKLQELQRQKDMRQTDTRQHNSVNQASPFATQPSGSHSHGLINGTPSSESSWAELATGNPNWLQRASPGMQGSSGGLAFTPEPGRMQGLVGLVHQQVDQSLYGVPVSSSRGPLNPYPYGNSFPGNQYAEIPEQVIVHDGTSVSRQGLPGKSLFGHTPNQGSNSWINMEQIQQLKATHQTGSEQEFQGPRDLIGPSEMAQDEPAIEAATSHGAASLDPNEEKFLFGSDENIWDAFGSDRNMGEGASNLLNDDEFASGVPSIQSGSWSALMQSAVAETCSSGIGLQEELTGLNFQNLQHPSKYEALVEQQTPLADVNMTNASAMNFGVNGAKMKDSHQRNMEFHHFDKGSPYGNSLPNNKQNDWTPVESIPTPGDTAMNINENDNLLQQSQSNNRTRGMHEEIGHGDGIWRINALSNSIPGSIVNREDFTLNSAAATPNLSNMQGVSHLGQSPSNSHQLNYWKHVESSVKSKGSGNSGQPQRHLNKGSHVSESSFNSSDKEDLKMHEIESRSKRENSNDSYHSSSSRQINTAHLREISSSDAGDLRASSNQSGRMTSGQRKFQYHPMGNLDEDVEMPYGKRQGINTHSMSLQHFQGLRGQDQGNLGHTKISGQVPRSSAEIGKRHVPDLEGISKGSHDMIGGHVPNMFAPFDRTVGLSTSEKISQPSQNMLELLHKVDQSRDGGTAMHLNSAKHNLSAEMPEPDYSDGSFQRSQSSNSQGFGLQLGLPSQRLPLPDTTSNFLSQAHVFPNLRDKGQAMFPSLPPFQENPYGGFKNNRIGSSEQNASEASVHKVTANLYSSSGAVFPNSRSQVQNHQTIGARGLALANNPDNPSLNRCADETCNGLRIGQSAEGCLPNKASLGRYHDAASSHERVQTPQTSGGEKLLPSTPQTSSSMPQHDGFSKTLPNGNTNLSTQQQLFATQAHGEHLNLRQSSQLNIVESTSIGLQNLEEQEAAKRGNLYPNFGTSSFNSKGLASAGQQSTKGSFSQSVTTSGPLGEESEIDASHMNSTTSQMDLEAFGRSLKPNNFNQNISLMNQMRAIRNMDDDPCNRVAKRLKGSDNLLDGQQVAPWSGQPNERNDMVKDASTCITKVPPGASQMQYFSGSVDTVERIVPFQPLKNVLPSGQNESQSSIPSNSMTSIKAEHSHISPQMAPSWFDRYGTFKNGQLLPERVNAVKSIEQVSSVERLNTGLETHGQASSVADTSQVGAILKNPAPVALEQSSLPSPTTADVQNLVTLRPKKRRFTTADLHPWLVEVLGSFKNLQGICTGAVEWSRAANRLMEKVDDDGYVIEDVLPISRPKRRLILTTLLMQQLLRPPPGVILSVDASSSYESVVYCAARLALGDACNLVSSARNDSSIPFGGTNCLSDKSEQSERIDDHHLSKFIEDFTSKAGKLEDDFLRLDKKASILDLRMEVEDLERFSVINRFAKFHGRVQEDGAETSSSEAAAIASKRFPQRYVAAVSMPANLPDRVQCLSL